MPKRLDPAVREENKRMQQIELKANIECAWLDQMDRAESLMPTVPAVLTGRKPLNASQVWLLLCLAEVEEYNRHVLQNGRSCRTAYVDDIAPRTRDNTSGWRRGVPGFTSRICAQMTEFVSHSKNGYARLTDLGFAAVMHLRNQHAELRQDVRPLRITGELEVPGFITLRNTSWRRWLEPVPPFASVPLAAASLWGNA